MRLNIKQQIAQFRFPVCEDLPLDLFSTDSRILLIAPHPDDEVFGLGGYLIKYRKKFAREDSADSSMNRFFVCYLTDGEASLTDETKSEVAMHRRDISVRVLHRLKLDERQVLRLHLPDGAVSDNLSLTSDDAAVSALNQFVTQYQVNVIIAPSEHEFWPKDHVAAFYLAKYLCEQTGCKLYTYWVWTWFNISVMKLLKLKKETIFRLPVMDVLDEKRELIHFYLRETNANGHSWCGILPPALLRAVKWKYEILMQQPIESLKRNPE